MTPFRDRPFNLEGGYGFLFRSQFFFRITPELEYLFFLQREARNLFQEFNRIHQNQNIFLEKNHKPSSKLNGRSLSSTQSYTIAG